MKAQIGSKLELYSFFKMAVGGQRHDPAALSPGKTQYSYKGELGGPQGRSGMVQKTLPPFGIRDPNCTSP
jgi:hypothetical protein